jgi:hypothetical protein
MKPVSVYEQLCQIDSYVELTRIIASDQLNRTRAERIPGPAAASNTSDALGRFMLRKALVSSSRPM